VQLYSVRDELARDLWGTLRKVKAMGYDGVEFFGEFSCTAQEVKAALEDTGLICCGWHTPLHYVQPNNLMATITYNKVIGNSEITIPGLPREMTNSKEAWINTAKQLNDVAAKLALYGMKLSYHNHADEFKPMEGDLPIHYLLTHAPLVGLQLDNGNAFSAGRDTDIYAPLTRFGGRIRTLHHKPYSLKDGFATMVGEDDIDWKRFFALCDTHQCVNWHIVEYEDEKYSQLEGIEKCLNAFKALNV
jgi:sugar phosphate isomerase/epimerase